MCFRGHTSLPSLGLLFYFFYSILFFERKKEKGYPENTFIGHTGNYFTGHSTTETIIHHVIHVEKLPGNGSSAIENKTNKPPFKVFLYRQKL